MSDRDPKCHSSANTACAGILLVSEVMISLREDMDSLARSDERNVIIVQA
jgi:hypothetical protein